MTSEPSSKRSRVEENGSTEDKDALISSLKEQVASLKSKVDCLRDCNSTYFASSSVVHGFSIQDDSGDFPKNGMSASHIKEMILQNKCLDFLPRLNTSSYVNVVAEPEEQDVALMGLEVNFADSSVYPASVQLHDKVVNIIAKLWNAPPPSDGSGKYCGAGTVGSTEACLLAGLALKFRWRHWYSARKGLTMAQVEGIKPNIVISTCYQAAWEKVRNVWFTTIVFGGSRVSFVDLIRSLVLSLLLSTSKVIVVASYDKSHFENDSHHYSLVLLKCCRVQFFRYFDVKPIFVKPNILETQSAADPAALAAACNEETIGIVGILGNHYNGVVSIELSSWIVLCCVVSSSILYRIEYIILIGIIAHGFACDALIHAPS